MILNSTYIFFTNSTLGFEFLRLDFKSKNLKNIIVMQDDIRKETAGRI